jgi:hypothetical protein
VNSVLISRSRLHFLENRFERRSEQICLILLFLFSFLLLAPTFSLPFFFFFFIICRCSLTRLVILHLRYASIHLPLSSVMCSSSPPLTLLLFAGCVFTLNKSFILFRSTLMGDLWDEC